MAYKLLCGAYFETPAYGGPQDEVAFRGEILDPSW
jgi:hypothetical protein